MEFVVPRAVALMPRFHPPAALTRFRCRLLLANAFRKQQSHCLLFLQLWLRSCRARAARCWSTHTRVQARGEAVDTVESRGSFVAISMRDVRRFVKGAYPVAK